jgi:hypothetical protein
MVDALELRGSVRQEIELTIRQRTRVLLERLR